MKQKITRTTVFAAHVIAMFAFTLSPISSNAGQLLLQQKPNLQETVSAGDKQAIVAFEERVKEYVRLREKLEEKMPKLSKDSTPEQIQAHKDAFQEAVRAARVGAKPGDVFTPDIANHMRAIIKTEFKGKERQKLRKEVLEETKGVAIRVNYPYPETKELVKMPATLLLKLPTLPKQVKYRFVGEHMLLVDRENGLIIDYMLSALP